MIRCRYQYLQIYSFKSQEMNSFAKNVIFKIRFADYRKKVLHIISTQTLGRYYRSHAKVNNVDVKYKSSSSNSTHKTTSPKGLPPFKKNVNLKYKTFWIPTRQVAERSLHVSFFQQGDNSHNLLQGEITRQVSIMLKLRFPMYHSTNMRPYLNILKYLQDWL